MELLLHSAADLASDIMMYAFNIAPLPHSKWGSVGLGNADVLQPRPFHWQVFHQTLVDANDVNRLSRAESIVSLSGTERESVRLNDRPSCDQFTRHAELHAIFVLAQRRRRDRAVTPTAVDRKRNSRLSRQVQDRHEATIETGWNSGASAKSAGLRKDTLRMYRAALICRLPAPVEIPVCHHTST
jgi:hypothetical protein